MTDLQKIIFVDVDGPLINTPCYFVNHLASVRRTVFNTQALGYLMDLVKLSGAKIVTNSTHNTHNVKRSGLDISLKDDMLMWGVHEKMFHENWMTSYPYPPESKFSESSQSRRMRAINLWMEENGRANWIAFDDEYFTDSTNLILIKFDLGIDHDAYTKACSLWGLEPYSYRYTGEWQEEFENQPNVPEEDMP